MPTYILYQRVPIFATIEDSTSSYNEFFLNAHHCINLYDNHAHAPRFVEIV